MLHSVRPLVAVAIVLWAGSVRAQPDFSVPAVDSALGLIGLTTKDLISDRIWAEDDTFLLPKIREALLSPTHAHAVSREFADAVPAGLQDLERVAEMMSFAGGRVDESVVKRMDEQVARAKPVTDDVFDLLLRAFTLAETYRQDAFSRLSAPQQRAMLIAMPLWFADKDMSEDDTLKGALHRSFGARVDTSVAVTEDSVLTLISLVDRDALAAGSYCFARGLKECTDRLRKMPLRKGGTIQVAGVDGECFEVSNTPFGLFVVGGYGPNVYRGDFAVIIDLGGDDRYLSRSGAAVAEIGHVESAVIDLSGNDAYLSPLIAGQACGVMGFGAIVDLEGDDVYRGGAFSQGAAFCGAGILVDESGDDLYQAGLFSQGAAVCGTGLLLDGSGRDVYDAQHSCQGFGSTFGAAALVDNLGNDVYRAGGTVPHAPLRPEDYRSFAQGFAIGARPRAGGGFGLLRDRQGNDFYAAEVYAQGVGYWYSLGILIDDAGNDAYNATQYAQGAGIHLAAGVLEDGSGDDRYGSRFGPGQGGAHDLAVALFWDRQGDDQYTMSGGQGMAINNSAAIFCDGAGNDHYNRIEFDLGQGGVNHARGFGSIAVFADAEGKDVHEGRVERDSTYWLRGMYGIGYDAPLDSVRPREVLPDVVLNVADTLRTVEDLFHDAALWEVTDNREKVKRARLALNAKGAAAVAWIGQNKLNSIEALERRAIAEVFKAFPDLAAPHLMAALDSDQRPMRRNAVSILSEMKYRPAAAPLMRKLREPDYEHIRPAILSALGELGDSDAVPLLADYAKSVKERERIGAVSSLGKLADSRGFDALFVALRDTAYTVRSAAVLAIAAQDTSIVSRLRRELLTNDPDHMAAVLMALADLGARWNDVDTLRTHAGLLVPLALAYIEHPEPLVQGAACVAAASAMSRESFERATESLKLSAHPLLQARWRQAQQRLRPQ